jgi:hypothetical protein
MGDCFFPTLYLPSSNGQAAPAEGGITSGMGISCTRNYK